MKVTNVSIKKINGINVRNYCSFFNVVDGVASKAISVKPLLMQLLANEMF